jgi:hypothetical protein
VTLPVAGAAALISTVPAGEVGRAPVATGYLILTTLLGAAAGGLFRHAVPATVLLLALYFVAGPLLRTRIGSYLPDTAVLDPSRGAAATVVWTLSAVTLAALVFRRRDA